MICKRCHVGIKDLILVKADTPPPSKTLGALLSAAYRDEVIDDPFTREHHQSLNDLLESVEEGCYICSKLNLHIRNKQQVSDLKAVFTGRPFTCVTKLRVDFGDQAPFYNLELIVKSDEMFESIFSFNIYPLDDDEV